MRSLGEYCTVCTLLYLDINRHACILGKYRLSVYRVPIYRYSYWHALIYNSDTCMRRLGEYCIVCTLSHLDINRYVYSLCEYSLSVYRVPK